jgi:hypothetical protein
MRPASFSLRSTDGLLRGSTRATEGGEGVAGRAGGLKHLGGWWGCRSRPGSSAGAGRAGVGPLSWQSTLLKCSWRIVGFSASITQRVRQRSHRIQTRVARSRVCRRSERCNRFSRPKALTADCPDWRLNFDDAEGSSLRKASDNRAD